MGSWKPGIKNCEFGKKGSNLASATERMSTFWISNHKDYQIYFGQNLCWYEKGLCSKGFLFLNFLKVKHC